MAVYIDTSAWIALHEPREGDHGSAKAALGGLHEEGEVLVCGWHTLVEFADGLARHYDQRRAHDAIARIVASPSVRLEPSEPHLERAMACFRDKGDWNVDLSDCISFAMMEALGVRKVFTYDSDFEKPGFTLIA